MLVAGGHTISTYLNSAALYDPSTGAWTMTINMNYARYHHSASILTNGKVLVTGGQCNSTFVWNSAELYQP